MRILINATSARLGGGVTVLRNLLPALCAQDGGARGRSLLRKLGAGARELHGGAAAAVAGQELAFEDLGGLSGSGGGGGGGEEAVSGRAGDNDGAVGGAAVEERERGVGGARGEDAAEPLVS